MTPGDGDPTLLRQLLTSLVGRAVERASTVEHGYVQVGSVERDGEPVYFVRDNGAGGDLDDAAVPVQAPGELASAGVGLAFCRQIVERHAGTVWAEGGLGGGATVFFTIGDGSPDVACPATGSVPTPALPLR
jgi:light-regulated signal transduction histidine kinase (bacteriophytochrome)